MGQCTFFNESVFCRSSLSDLRCHFRHTALWMPSHDWAQNKVAKYAHGLDVYNYFHIVWRRESSVLREVTRTGVCIESNVPEQASKVLPTICLFHETVGHILRNSILGSHYCKMASDSTMTWDPISASVIQDETMTSDRSSRTTTTWRGEKKTFGMSMFSKGCIFPVLLHIRQQN